MKLREYFLVCEENKNNDFIQQFILFNNALTTFLGLERVSCIAVY